MANKVLAAVRTAPGKTEIREFPMPDIAEDAALMRMEVAGICGTDVKLYEHPPSAAPVIMGHENIGYIEKCGKEFTRRKDDNAETMKTRMAAYRAQTEPLLPYYGARGVLKKVDGMAAMDEVYRQIRAVLAGA